MDAWIGRIAAGLIGSGLVLVATTGAVADDPPDYGFDWVTVGAPGNRVTLPDETPRWPTMNAGAVGYEYRMMRTQVTVEQWLDFVVAYTPFLDTTWPGDWTFSGTEITWDPGTGEHHIIPGSERLPTNPAFQYAARFANWMHNGKVNEKWAFEDGVYDTSTFTQNPDHTWNSQEHRKPGSKFWLPSYDEWVKAFHYDPDRYGPGEEGYWLYPDGGQEPLVSGWPWEGGETSAGLEFLSGPYLDVGSYPWTQSPWGLLDASGSETDLLEDFGGNQRRERILGGTQQFWPDPEDSDRLDFSLARPPHIFGSGLRLASVVPSPGSGIILILSSMSIWKRRRR